MSRSRTLNAIGYYVTRIPDDGTPTMVLPEVTPGSDTSVVDTGLDSQQAYSYTVAAVYPTSITVSGPGGSNGGSGGGSSGGGGSGGGSSSTGAGSGSAFDPTVDSTAKRDRSKAGGVLLSD